MTLDERHQQIIRVLNERTRASVAELADITGASTMTVRRDLELLESQGALRRVHGAAVSTMLSGEEAPYAIRAMTDTGVKDKLASAVGEVLVDGETVVLESGTSATAAARALGQRRLTVTPLSLHAVQELIQHDHIQLLMTGGQIRPGELSFYGQLTVQGFADLRYDTFIMGCCGIDADGVCSAVTRPLLKFRLDADAPHEVRTEQRHLVDRDSVSEHGPRHTVRGGDVHPRRSIRSPSNWFRQVSESCPPRSACLAPLGMWGRRRARGGRAVPT